MGSLILPAGGAVCLDAQSIIYSVQRHPRYSSLLAPLWTAFQTGTVRIATSQLSLMECLVGPLQWRDPVLQADFERFFRLPGLGLIPIDESILRRAAQLRAMHRSLRTPDALHAATALSISAALFVTNDRGFRAVHGLPLAMLDDILGSP